MALFVGATLLLFPKLFTKRSVIALFVYGLLSFIFFLLENAFFSSFSVVIVPFLCMLSGLLIAEYAIQYDKNYDYTKMVILLVLGCDVLMSLITIPKLWERPDLIYGMNINSEMSTADRSYYSFVISYQTIHGLSLLIAPLVFLCKKELRLNFNSFVIFTLITIVLLYIVIVSNGTTALLVSLLMATIALFINVEKFNKKNIKRLIFIGALGFLLIQPSVLSPVLSFIQGTMDSSSGNAAKIGSIQDKLLFGESTGDLSIREDLYSNSANLFLESPIWGTSTPQLIGLHSFILDRLALYGIIFIIPLVFVFFYNYNNMYKSLRHTKVIYVFSIMGMIFMLYMKNDFEQGTWLYGFAYLPLLCRYIDYITDKQSTNNS